MRQVFSLILLVLLVMSSLAPAVRAETPTTRAMRLSARFDSDGRNNPLTNELTYPELHLAYLRRVGPAFQWQLGGGLGNIFGAETTGITTQLGGGVSVRSAGELFVGAQVEAGWSFNHYGYYDANCDTHGVLGRATLEVGLRVGTRGAVVVSGGYRARKIVSHTCDGVDGDSRDLNTGPAVGVSYEWWR